MKFRGGKCEDLKIKDLWKSWLITEVIILAIIAVCIGLYALCSAPGLNHYFESNEAIAEFNTLPLESRQALSHSVSFAVSKDYLAEFYDTRPLFERLQSAPFGIWLGALLLVILTPSLAMFLEYRSQKDKAYYYANFPMPSPLYFCTFCFMYAVLPVFLVSGLRMLGSRLGLIKLECREVDKLAEKEIGSTTWRLRTPQPAKITAKTRRNYCNLRVRKRLLIHQRTIEEAQHRESQLRQQLDSLGYRVRSTQQSLSRVKAELRELQQTPPSEEATKQQASAELDAIAAMRGVTSIDIHSGKEPQKLLSFVVEVRVPYQDEVYDFGDYQVTLGIDKFQCKLLRSGVKRFAEYTSPDYSTHKGFCFGNRESTILEYVCAGRYVEAATLIVDSLHSVNNENVEARIPGCFRKVRTVESRAQLLRLKLRLVGDKS